MITAERFKQCVGVDPVDDDLERCNCEKAGHMGHWSCGWDIVRQMPVFVPGMSEEVRLEGNIHEFIYGKTKLK